MIFLWKLSTPNVYISLPSKSFVQLSVIPCAIVLSALLSVSFLLMLLLALPSSIFLPLVVFFGDALPDDPVRIRFSTSRLPYSSCWMASFMHLHYSCHLQEASIHASLVCLDLAIPVTSSSIAGEEKPSSENVAFCSIWGACLCTQQPTVDPTNSLRSYS